MVLVIDDNSPDGTGELADRLAAELDGVEVLHRPRKEGLGPAYLAGFRRALELGAQLVVEIDCDFSHDPADVPRLLDAAADADLVLGSRYVPGGSVADWGVVRKAISRAASLYTQVLLMPVKDADRGLQVLSPDGARADRPRGDRVQGLHVPDRDDLPGPAGGLPGDRGADPLHRPRGRRLEDVALDRARGDLEGAAPAPRRAERKAVKDVTDATFEEEVLRASGATIVDFWAPWCKPCEAIAPILEALAADHGLGLVRVNIDEHLGVPSRYGVLSLPTVILFEDGQPKTTVVGARPRSHFERAFGLLAGEVLVAAQLRRRHALALLAAPDHRELAK